MKKITVKIAYTKVITVKDETHERLREENLAGQIDILEEISENI